MKKRISFLLLLAVLLSLCTACRTEKKTISCDAVITAYQNTGYTVWHKDYPEKENGYLCRIEIQNEGGESISFSFFENESEADAYADQHQWNWAVWLYSLALLQPTWVTTKTHSNIVIEYVDKDLYKPFEQLT